jgi:hypothetical protein
VRIDRAIPPARRVQDIHSRVERLVTAGKVDPDEARWYLLGRQIVAQHRHESWLRCGAPRRRASDRA